MAILSTPAPVFNQYYDSMTETTAEIFNGNHTIIANSHDKENEIQLAPVSQNINQVLVVNKPSENSTNLNAVTNSNQQKVLANIGPDKFSFSTNTNSLDDNFSVMQPKIDCAPRSGENQQKCSKIYCCSSKF